MDKQLIERIKAEVRAEMRSEFGPSVESFIDAYADRLIERIDAERGKSAAAWLHDITHNDDPRQHDEALAFTPDAFPLDGCGLFTSVGSRPLFLSPTIPEGMALVPKQVNYFDAQKIADEYGLDYNKFCVAHSAMLAAAQGERK